VRALFWLSSGLVVYAYVGLPALMLLRAALRPRPPRVADITPSVTLIVAAYNEAAHIGAKLASLLALDYPSERLEILVASDGSTDGTNQHVARVEDPRVRLLALPRVGKARALNEAVAVASGEILVFSDANSMFDPGALRALVAPFADPQVGAVAGDQRYTRVDSSGPLSAAEEVYWALDRRLKVAGSRGGSITSATGAIHALRRDLVDLVPDGVTDDFFLSTGAVLRGRRLVFAPDAIAREPVAESVAVEFGRKVRIVARGLRSVRARSQLLSPRRYGMYAVQLWTHKVLRRLVVVPLLVCLVTSVAGALTGDRLLLAAALAQGLLYGAAALGGALAAAGRRPGALLRLPAYFCLVNAAAAVALVQLVRGRAPVRWEPRREPLPAADASEDGGP
jgi:cellulose synthase/poly-beta-1,6-N-acetylglucosamine synthase-like glycosyltransferase